VTPRVALPPTLRRWGLAQGAPLLTAVPPEAWHTHHTPAEDTLHLSEGRHGGVPALVVEVPAAPEAARPRPVRLHGVGQLGDALLRGCRKGRWEGGTGTPWHRRWWQRPCQGCRESGDGVAVPGHCLQQSEGLARTGLAQVSRGHCTFSQCTSPVVPCGERGGLAGGHGAGGTGHAPPSQRGGPGRWARTRTHLAGANGTFNEAKGGHDGVPAGARASPCLVPVKIAAWERRRRRRR